MLETIAFSIAAYSAVFYAVDVITDMWFGETED